MIHQIHIENYKSLRSVAVDLSPVTVFIGRSGTGKTNFTSAIRFLRDYLAHGHQSLQQQFPACRCVTNPTGTMQFKVVFEVPGFTERFTYGLDLGQHIHFPEMESLEYGTTTIFRQVKRGQGQGQGAQWVTPPALVSVPQSGFAALGRLPGLEEAVIAYTALTTAIGVYTFPYDVLNASAQRGGASGGLADNGQNFLDVMGAIARDLYKPDVRKAIAASLRRINETVVNVEINSVQNPQQALVGHRLEEKTLTLGLAQESDGFRRFYAHLLALYQLPPKQTLVFEEPENGIYPGALSLLSDEFQAAPDAGSARRRTRPGAAHNA
jgi:predicted ATPase